MLLTAVVSRLLFFKKNPPLLFYTEQMLIFPEQVRETPDFFPEKERGGQLPAPKQIREPETQPLTALYSIAQPSTNAVLTPSQLASD